MKRIILCADGTWNVRDQLDKQTGKRRPTNVTKIARAIRARAPDGVDQIVFYHDGIGTEGGAVDQMTDGALGSGMEDNIRTLYRFLLYNHRAGDELYFFGFSRGAFTVRSLAGFLNKVGLVEKEHDYFVPDLYDCYEQGAGPGSAPWQHAFRHIATPPSCPPIRMIGVWDTVGALGAPGILGRVVNRGKYKYHDVGLHPTIAHAYHALAIDEARPPFAPDLWTRPQGWTGTLEQAWFAGVHSNVGGSYTPDGLANEPLHWMVEKAEGLGLVVDSDYLAPFEPHFEAKLHDSMSLKYRLMGGPQARTIGQHRADGEYLHQSAVDRWNHAPSAYRPDNLAPFVGGAGALPVAQTTRIARGPRP
ncbi:MAG TPA: DUF2235 domain-containing protein [Vineibacter sp.]|nr:DUF2235 domain-containing protein [Vineibacter sp.]